MRGKKIDALYYRLSLADGDLANDERGKKESNSISSQRICIQEYIKTNRIGGHELVEFIDDGYSGTSFERPGFQSLLFEVLQGNVRTIIIKDLSRLGRNYLEVGYYLEKVFPAYQVRVILINDNYDSVALGEVTLRQDFVLKNLINEWYSKDISVKIKSVVDSKKMAGEFVYGTAPFGYKKGTSKNTIEIDQEAAEIVRRVFSMANEGRTISQIAQKLNEMKIITPSVYMAKIRKNYKIREFWTYESVRNIIENRIYTGDTEAFKSHVVQVGSDRVKSIPRDKRPVIEHTHTPIITREEYFNARRVVKSKAHSTKTTEPDMLSGYLVCGSCGNHLVKGKPTNKNYYCTSARYRPKSDCSKVKVSKEDIKSIVFHSIQMQLLFADSQLKMSSKLDKSNKSTLETLKRELRRVNNQIENFQENSMLLYEEYVERKIDKEVFFEKKKQLADNQTQSEQIKRELEEQIQLHSTNHKSQDVRSDRVQKYLNVEELDKSMLKEFVKSIIIMPDGSLNIEWNFRQAEAIIEFAAVK